MKRNKPRLRALLWGALCVACWASVAQAQDAEAFMLYLAATRAVDADMLETMRGGAEVLTNDILANGTVGQNAASNLVTGNNFVSTGALQGASGFSTVVQNSGNNVLIQNSTIINLQLQ